MIGAILNWLYDLSGANIFYAHAICLTNDPILMTLYVAGDLTTFASYMVIGGTLLVHRVHTMRFTTAALVLYGAFIALCGLSHLTKTLTLFVGMYRLDILVVAAMASVSAVTAGYTICNIRHILENED